MTAGTTRESLGAALPRSVFEAPLFRGLDARAQRVRGAQGRRHPGEIVRQVHVPTNGDRSFEHGKGPGQIALAQGQQTEPPRGVHHTHRGRGCLGNPQAFFPKSPACGERAQLRMAPGQVGTGEHGGHEDKTALVAPGLFKGCDGLPEAVNRPTIVALGLIGLTEVLVGRQDHIPIHCVECEGALGRGDGLVILAHLVTIVCQKEQDPSEPARVSESLSEGLGLTQTHQDAPQVAERTKGRTQSQPEVDGLLKYVALLRQMRESTERLLKVPDGLAVG